MLSEMLIQVQY